MNAQMLAKRAAQGFILLSTLSLLSVSLMALVNPQSVMDLVQVKLPNTDAYSSIRGIYGGVGLTLCISLVYMMRYHLRIGPGFLCLFWGSYALSRAITILVDGPLGAFGSQWIVIETIFFSVGVGLLWATAPTVQTANHSTAY